MSMSTSTHYDALILGSGQAGTPLATHIRSLSLSVCLVERAHIAGCCVNEGCTPTKTMVASGRVAHLAHRAADYGVQTGTVNVDMKTIRQRKRDIVESFRGSSEKRLAGAGVDVVFGEARFVGEKEVVVQLRNAEGGQRVRENRLSADRVFINVGCRPSRPSLQGLETIEQGRVLDSTSIQELDEVPTHLVVVGGGYIGLEFAQLFRRLGARVSILHRGPALLSRKDDPELVRCMLDILRGDGIDVLLNSADTSFEKSDDPALPITIYTSSDGANKDIRASHILLATGRVPNTDTLNLSAAGIKTSPTGHILVSPALESNITGVYALGDVKGGPAFTHISYDDFRIIRDNLFPLNGFPPSTKTTETRAPLVPSVVYTDPQFAHIGPKWGDLPRGRKVITFSMPASWIARGLETDETRGMVKAVVDAETERIVSFGAITVEGGELVAVVQMAMVGGIGWKALREAVWAHPSWAEGLNNVWGGERWEGVVG